MTVLSKNELSAALNELEGWEGDSEQITRQFEFADFRQAVAFVVRVAFEAEAANHHPDLDVRYNKVTVNLSTHSDGGVTAKDVDLARAIDAVAR